MPLCAKKHASLRRLWQSYCHSRMSRQGGIPLRRRFLSGIQIFVFLLSCIGPLPLAQADDFVSTLLQSKEQGILVRLSPEFIPAHLVGVTVHPDNALQFDFLIHHGDDPLNQDQKKDQYTKLIKYFLASLTIPDEDQWVNLSPYEKDRIIKDDFGKTEMGRDLLAQDYILKQITSSLIYPESSLGKKFWDKIYERAWKEYHTTSIPVNTFNKVWIVPDQAIVYESGSTAYILKSHLKVMLEQDYLALKKNTSKIVAPPAILKKSLEGGIPLSIQKTQEMAGQVIRAIILPELEKEVNLDKNFANLRQMYSGMILATWYKHVLKESLLGKVYADKAKVKGVDQDPKANGVIYKQYLKAFKKGVFNYIKEDVDKYTNEAIPRKYFSGGWRNTIPDIAKYYNKQNIPSGLVDPAALAGDVQNTDRAEISLNTINDRVGQAERKDAAMTKQEEADKILEKIEEITSGNILKGHYQSGYGKEEDKKFFQKSLPPAIKKNTKLKDTFELVKTLDGNYVAGVDAVKLFEFLKSAGIDVAPSLQSKIEKKDIAYIAWSIEVRDPNLL